MRIKKSHSKFEELVNRVLKESMYGGNVSSMPTNPQQQAVAALAPQVQQSGAQDLNKQLEVAKKETEEAKKQSDELKKERKNLEDYQKKMVAIQAQAASKTPQTPTQTSQTTPTSNAPIAGANVQQVIQNLLNMGKTM